jgi:hypothetical protein
VELEEDSDGVNVEENVRNDVREKVRGPVLEGVREEVDDRVVEMENVGVLVDVSEPEIVHV